MNDGALGFYKSVTSSRGLSVPIRITIEGGSALALHADNPSCRGLFTGMTSPLVVDVDGTDMVRDTIAMTPEDVADMSPSVHLASGTSISIHGGWVASGCATPAARVVDVSSSTDRLSSVCSAVDTATGAAGSSTYIVITIDVIVAAGRPRMSEDVSPVPVTSCPPTDRVVVTGDVCADGVVAVLALPPPYLGMASTCGCHAAQRMTLFLALAPR
jgi:hypothetical protein